MEETFYLSGSAGTSISALKQFGSLVCSLEELGFKRSTSFPSKYFICLNHNSKSYKEFIKFGGKPENAALVMLEPFVVYPAQYSQKIFNSYAVILSPGNPAFKDYWGDFIPWPYEVVANPLKPMSSGRSLRSRVEENAHLGLFEFSNWSKRENFLSLINSNKVTPVRCDNYKLRRVYANSLPANLLTVYGDLWSSSTYRKLIHRFKVFLFSAKTGYIPDIRNLYGNLHWRFKSARGLLEDKHSLLQSSKFSIVIENDSSYISEKILDVLINGCIPVYLGPQNIDAIIPGGTYLRLQNSPDELLLMLKKLSNFDIQDLLNNIYKFVTSQDFSQKWDAKNVYRQLASSIAKQFKESNG